MFNRKKIKALEKELERARHLINQEQMVHRTYGNCINSQEITIKELKEEIEEWKLKYLNMVEKNIKLAEMRMRINDR